MLLKDQADISAKRPMPVENMDDSSKVVSETGETVALYYYNSGVLTADAGQLAGVNVIGKFAYAPILDGIGSKVANKDNTSLAFTCLAFTNQKPFPHEKLEQSLETSGTTLLDLICTGFSNGDYTVDYRTGTVYGKKATTATSMTVVSYKRPSSTATVDVGDIEIGAVELKDGASDVRATISTIGSKGAVATQIVDASGNQITSFGSPSTIADYRSPKDFTATFTTTSTLTLTGLPFTLLSGVNVVYIKVRKAATNTSAVYVNGAGGYTFGHLAGVLTVYKDGVASAVFTDATDMLEIGINDQQKAYDLSTDTTKVINQSPDRSSYVQDSLVDTTNVGAGTVYYPAATGMSMDGFKDMSLTGKIIEGDAVTDTISVEGTNDEDTTHADWVQIYGYDSKANAMSNLVTTGGVAGTYTFAWEFDNLNYTYYRIKLVVADSTNTVIIKMRRKSL